MTATHDEPTPIEPLVRRPSRVEWPEPDSRRGTTTFASTLLFAAAFGGTQLVARLLGPSRLGFLMLACFGLAAVAVALTCVVGLRRKRRVRVVQEAIARGRPVWDADWRGGRATLGRSILSRRVPAQVHMILVVLIAMAVSFLLDASPGVETWIAAFVLASLFVIPAAWLVFRGGAQLTFERFPYLLGTRATFFVATTTGSPRLEDASVLLRCVGPAYDLEGRVVSNRFPVTKWSRVVELPPDRSPGPDEFVDVTFDLPADRPGTTLHAEAPVRWELLVHGRTRWGKLTETFVVPVYAAPA